MSDNEKNKLGGDQQLHGVDPRISPTVLGIAFLVSSFLSSFVAAYLSIQSSVDKYIDANKEIRVLELKSKGGNNDKTNEELSTLRTKLSELNDKLVLSNQELQLRTSEAEQKAGAFEREAVQLREQLSEASKQH